MPTTWNEEETTKQMKLRTQEREKKVRPYFPLGSWRSEMLVLLSLTSECLKTEIWVLLSATPECLKTDKSKLIRQSQNVTIDS